MAASFFSQPPIAYFQPLESPPDSCTPSFIACETPEPPDCRSFGGNSFTEFETISSKVCGWAGELGKDHDLRQSADPCTWLFSEQATPFPVGAELPSSALIPAAQRQPRVDFISSAAAMKNIFRATCDQDSDVGVMVHRLGDWLVMDDGTEISEFISNSRNREGGSASEFVTDASRLAARAQVAAAERAAEQRHRAAVTRAERAEACASEAQQRLENAWVVLRQAEAEAQKAQELLHEALEEVGQALEELDEVHRKRAAVSSTRGDMKDSKCRTPPRSPIITSQRTSRELDLDSSLQSLESLDIEVDAPEEHQLYQNFLGHSILRALHDETAPWETATPLEATSSGAHSSSNGRELFVLDGPATFRQVGVWKIADDASVVIGSRMLCLGNAEHPKLTLYLHHHAVLSDMILLEHCIECLIAGVPEFAICFHRDGAVQYYSLYKLSELWTFLEERLAIGRKLWMTLEALRWIKRQCSSEGCTYWLAKAKNEPTLKLFKLSSAQMPKEREPPPGVVSNLPKDLVLKNTFLHLAAGADEAADAEYRRSQSCPARVYGPSPLDYLDVGCPSYPGSPPSSPSRATFESFLGGSRPLEPMRGRVSALFFRRAISSPPGDNARRFFLCALDLESACDPVRLDSSTHGSHCQRLLLQSFCHLGIALCGLTLPRPDCDGPETEGGSAETLLSDLRADAPVHRKAQESCGKYRFVSLGSMKHYLPLLGICVPPWPSRSQGTGMSKNIAEPPAAFDVFCHITDALLLYAAAVPCGGVGLPHRDRRGVEAMAFPLVALALLHIASDLARYSMSPCKASGAPQPILAAISLAWRILGVARQFAALDAAQQRPKVHAFFSNIPEAQDLLIRIEHLCGGLLLTSASQALSNHCSMVADCLAAESWFVEVQRRLSKLEHCLGLDPARVESAMQLLGSQLNTPATELDVAVGANVAAAAQSLPLSLPPQDEWYVQAAWHYERSIRLLPKSMHRGGAINQLILVLASALIEVAAHVAEGMNAESLIESRAFADGIRKALEADQHLHRAEGLADAAGHKAMAAVVQASRGNLRGCAADMLVRLALASGAEFCEATLDAAGVGIVRDLFSCDDESEDEEQPDTSTTVGHLVGRLGDLAMDWVLSAQSSVDSVVNQEAARALSVMSSGVLQAGAARLWAWPPPHLDEADWRRSVVTLITQSLQHLPQTHHSDIILCQSMHEVHLYAHAHVMQAEVILDLRNATEKAQQRQQRVAWHTERARSALHSASSTGDIASVLLARLSLIQAKQLGQSSSSSRRQIEQALEELVTGCRTVSSPICGTDEAEMVLAAKDACCKLLLQQLQAALRVLCTRETVQKQGRSADAVSSCQWKDFYRATLQLSHSEVSTVPSLYDSIVGKGV